MVQAGVGGGVMTARKSRSSGREREQVKISGEMVVGGKRRGGSGYRGSTS